MRPSILLLCLLAVGCGSPPAPVTVTPTTAAVPLPAPVVPAPENVPDLRTRKFGSDWTAFLGPTANSVSTEKGIINPWPKEGLRVVWSTEAGKGYVVPAVSRGRLFFIDTVGNQNRLRCLKSETGEPLWQFAYDTDYEDYYGYEGARVSPIVDGGRVYIFGPEGMLFCLGVTDGKVVWKVDTKAKFGVVQNFFGAGSPPVVEGDLLLVQIGGSPPKSPPITSEMTEPNGSALVAFDKFTGAVKYRTGDELASYAAPRLATIDGKRWCFLFARGGLLGLDPADGKVAFHFPWRARMLESVNASTPVVIGDQVFISECYQIGSALLKIKPTGAPEVVWSDSDKGRDKSMRCHWMTPIHVDGYLYGGSGRNPPDSDLRCIELATGKVMWKENVQSRCSLLQVDGHFICLDEQGPITLLKINPQKYEEVSRLELNVAQGDRSGLLKDPCWAAPVLAHGLLYVRGKDRLVCLELIPQDDK